MSPVMTTLRLSSQPRPLGKSDILVSPIAWGMWRLAGDDLAAVRARIDAAREAGITLFDTADIYGTDTPAGFGSAEALFGDVLTWPLVAGGACIIAGSLAVVAGERRVTAGPAADAPPTPA